MTVRLPINKNETLHTEESYRGLHVITHHGPLITRYLEGNFQTIEGAVADWQTVFAIRFDLSFPAMNQIWPENAIQAFLASVDAQVHAYVHRRRLQCSRVKPRFMWVKEEDGGIHPHYHLVLLLDGDVFCSGSVIYKDNWSLRECLKKAWSTALCMPFAATEGLVNFKDPCEYLIRQGDPYFLYHLSRLFWRASYFAKIKTKQYGANNPLEKNRRSYSCSYPTVLPQDFSLGEIIEFHKTQYWGMEPSEVLYSPDSLEAVKNGQRVEVMRAKYQEFWR